MYVYIYIYICIYIYMYIYMYIYIVKCCKPSWNCGEPLFRVEKELYQLCMSLAPSTYNLKCTHENCQKAQGQVSVSQICPILLVGLRF